MKSLERASAERAPLTHTTCQGMPAQTGCLQCNGVDCFYVDEGDDPVVVEVCLVFFVAGWAFHVRGKEAIASPNTWDVAMAAPQEALGAVCKLLPPSAVLPRVWNAEGSLPEQAKEEWLHQKWWVTQVEKQQQEHLLSKASGRDVVRLQCLSRNASGAWLHAIPSKALGLEFSPAVFRTLLKFWLGLPVVEATADGSAVCPYCEGPCDVYGDHLLCCKKVEFYSRHQAVVEFLTKYIRAAAVENDGQIGGRLRPADLLMTRWSGEYPCAADVVVTHPLAPSLGLSSAAAAGAVRSKAARKKAKYAELVATHNLEFVPLAFSTFGEAGEDCLEFLSQAVTFYCAKQDIMRTEGEGQFKQQLSVALMRQVGHRLLAAVSLW